MVGETETVGLATMPFHEGGATLHLWNAEYSVSIPPLKEKNVKVESAMANHCSHVHGLCSLVCMYTYPHHLASVISRPCETQRFDLAGSLKSRISLPGLEIGGTKFTAEYYMNSQYSKVSHDYLRGSTVPYIRLAVEPW